MLPRIDGGAIHVPGRGPQVRALPVGRETFRRLLRSEGLHVRARKAPKPRTAPHLQHLVRASAPGQVWAIDFQFDSDWKGACLEGLSRH